VCLLTDLACFGPAIYVTQLIFIKAVFGRGRLGSARFSWALNVDVGITVFSDISQGFLKVYHVV
jgi:hypothetical protein